MNGISPVAPAHAAHNQYGHKPLPAERRTTERVAMVEGITQRDDSANSTTTAGFLAQGNPPDTFPGGYK